LNEFFDLIAWGHLEWVLIAISVWLLIGMAGMFALRRFTLVARVLFPIGGMTGIILFGAALSSLFSDVASSIVLPVGLPQLPFHFRLDSLSSYFLMIIGAVSAGVSAFAAGYFRKGEGTPSW
jgi:formate hydrogenlyase subunit 3/multisubunit Na+/H+ antiporter MnhD subunit